MAFALIKPAGWAFAELLTQTQMNDLDADHADAIDGVNGGTYTFAAPLVVGGSGWTFNNNVTFNEDVTIGSSSFDMLTILATVEFGAAIEFTDDVTLGDSPSDVIRVEGTLSIQADVTLAAGTTLTTNGNTILGNSSGDALTVNATATFAADVEFAEPVTFENTTRFEGALSIQADAIWASGTTLQTNGTTVLGSSDGDSLTVNATAAFEGPVTFRDNTTIGTASGDALTVTATSTFGNRANFNALVDCNDDVNLGSSSSDAIAIIGTATLHTPLEYDGNGRVPRRFLDVWNVDTTLAVADGNCFRVGGSNVYTISETGAVEGDEMWFVNDGGATLNFSGATLVLNSTETAWLVYMNSNWVGHKWTFTGGS